MDRTSRLSPEPNTTARPEEYGGDAVVQRVTFGVLGVGILAFTLAVHRWFGDGRLPRPSTVFPVRFGLGVIGAGAFQSNPATPGSTTNRLHDSASAIALLAGVIGTGLTSRRLDRDAPWPRHRVATPATVAAGVTAASLSSSVSRRPGLGSHSDCSWAS